MGDRDMGENLVAARLLRCKEYFMALSIGIVGLPSVGKSTLSPPYQEEAGLANYPFAIDPTRRYR